MRCFLCSQTGHKDVNCPTGKPRQVSPGKPWGSKRVAGNSCIVVEKPDHQCSNEALMKYGCRFSVVQLMYLGILDAAAL